jgi:polysaccharide biosynthesis protein PslH
MNVVIIGGSLPFPPDAGNRIRTLNLIQRLSRRHRITYLCRRDGDRAAARAGTEYLNDHGVEVHEVGHAIPPKSGPLFYGRLAANLASPLPYSVASHNSRRVRQETAAFAAAHRVDLWQAEGAPYVETLRGLIGVRKLLMAHNVESLIWKRYYETERLGPERWYIRTQWKKFERFERWAFAACDLVVAVSPEDATLARKEFGAGRVDVVDNGIDRGYFEPVRPDRDPKRILFLGSLEWRPNLDAVGLLLDRIFPAVLAAEPAARLCIVGRNPPLALARRVGSLPNVELNANVADVRPYLAKAGVMVVPLRIGGGSRLKILEALACGLPVVSTRVGAEGLRISPGGEFVQAESPEEMARALLECLNNPAPAREMADRGRRLVLEQYDWDALAERLERCWEAAAGSEVSVPKRPVQA